ncbi:FAD-dependent oxidoreductase [Paenibacillus sp. J45TS6]|uniref:NAD(P)/FAD-dependent oxidoreductase n=1 Tax=unclassified Paenibacillus TaxID=185978 RepID=UPI001B2987DC|nr:FAD-dependent oxidoreductase [Paenibacillus sp. J45TS6]GIP42690.1 FAD-dependent oxidoreductase [Paenibacillus sp. J45TS6]
MDNVDNMDNMIDVVIMGAGIGGSAAAIQLAEKGHQVLLIDRQAFPRHKTCGEFMSPETKEMLAYLGVNPLEHGVKPTTMKQARIILPSGKEMEARLPGEAWGISRYELDLMLHKKTLELGVKIKTKAMVTNVQQQEDHTYLIETKQGQLRETYHAKAVIGAYGIRKPRGVPTDQEAERRDLEVFVGVKSHYTGIQAADEVELYFCDGGYVGISPVNEGVVNIAALLSFDMVQRSGKSIEEILSEAASSNSRLSDRLSKGTPVQGTQVSISPVRLSEEPEPWSFFPHIGDAMLMIPPLCGDGMSIALRSSMICSIATDQYLKGKLTYLEWESNYTLEANREFSDLLRRARRIQKMAFSKANQIFPIIGQLFPSLSSYLVKSTRLSELGVTRS